MGQLKPGASYVYERQGGKVYAREHGTEDRILIGWDWEYDTNPARVRGTTRERVEENELWHDIRTEAQTNSALQKALDRVIIMYKLSKDKL